MKKVIKIVLALVIVVGSGLWILDSITSLNKQAEALEVSEMKNDLTLNKQSVEKLTEVKQQALKTKSKKEFKQRELKTQSKQIINEVKQPDTKTKSTKVKKVDTSSEPKPVKEVKADKPSTNKVVEVEKKETKTPFSKSIVKKTAKKFAAPFDFVKPSGKVEGYKNKEHLIHEYYMTFCEESISRKFVHFFFFDKIDGLYMVGTEPPYLLEAERDFTITKINENKYQAKQAIDKNKPSDAAFVMVDYVYNKANNIWKIKDVTYQY